MELSLIYLEKGGENCHKEQRSMIRSHTLDKIANGLGRHQLRWENPVEAKFRNFEGEQLHFGPLGTQNSGFLGRKPHLAVLHKGQRKTARC